jgi:hypothetical protein
MPERWILPTYFRSIAQECFGYPHMGNYFHYTFTSFSFVISFLNLFKAKSTNAWLPNPKISKAMKPVNPENLK